MLFKALLSFFKTHFCAQLCLVDTQNCSLHFKKAINVLINAPIKYIVNQRRANEPLSDIGTKRQEKVWNRKKKRLWMNLHSNYSRMLIFSDEIYQETRRWLSWTTRKIVYMTRSSNAKRKSTNWANERSWKIPSKRSILLHPEKISPEKSRRRKSRKKVENCRWYAPKSWREFVGRKMWEQTEKKEEKKRFWKTKF